MIYLLLYVGLASDPFFFIKPGYKPWQINENPQCANRQQLDAKCVVVKDSSFFGNSKMNCGGTK